MKSASNDKAMKVIKNWKMTNNTDVTYVKSSNPINPLSILQKMQLIY